MDGGKPENPEETHPSKQEPTTNPTHIHTCMAPGRNRTHATLVEGKHSFFFFSHHCALPAPHEYQIKKVLKVPPHSLYKITKFSAVNLSLRTQTYFWLLLVSAENNVCKPEPGNHFCDIRILSQSQFSSSSLRTTAQGTCIRCEEALEFHSIMESDWPKRNKSHYVTEIVSWLTFADIIFGRDKQQKERLLRLQAM